MNCFDFDKTIYRKDCSIKFYLYCLRKKPIMIFHIIKVFFLMILNKIGFITTKRFKEQFFSFLTLFNNITEIVSNFWDKELKNINEWYINIKQDSDIICSASPEFIVKEAINRINPSAKVVCTQMNSTTGLITGENLKGSEKVVKLKELFGNELRFNAVYTDSLSDFPLLDLTSNKYIVCDKNIYEFGKQKPTPATKLKYIIKQLRIKHYVKNGLIFLPLFFSSSLNDVNLIFKTIIGFIAFCLIASFVYILNDLMDAKNDRLHTNKRKRPIASYMIKKSEAIILAIILLLTSITITYLTWGPNLIILSILIGYAVINLLYSTFLKTIPIIDAFILSACYLIRVYFGGFIINKFVSKWMYLTILCGSLYMGFGKRRNEIKNEQNTTRKVNKYYNYNFLDKNLYVCLTLSLVFYSLWAINFHIFDYNSINRLILLATIPLVYFIMMRYSLDIEQTSNSGDPIDVLLRDKVLICFSIIFVTMIVIAVYIPIQSNWGLLFTNS